MRNTQTHGTQLISQTQTLKTFKISTLTWWKPKALWDDEQRQDHVAELHSVQVGLHDVLASGSKSVTHGLCSGHTVGVRTADYTILCAWSGSLNHQQMEPLIQRLRNSHPALHSCLGSDFTQGLTLSQQIISRDEIKLDTYSTVTFNLILKTNRNACQYFNVFIIILDNVLLLIQHKLL